MSTPIISVEEGRVTVTANDTEANIRAGAGFAESDEAETSKDAAADVRKDAADNSKIPERDETGKFKSKADEPAKPDLGGDPRKSHQAKINQATAKQREAERRAEEAERRAIAYEAELQQLRQPRPQPTPQPVAQVTANTTPAAATPNAYVSDVQRYTAMPDAPKLDEFTSLDDPYSAWQAAMSVFIADQRLTEREQRYHADRQKFQRQERITSAFDQLDPQIRELIQTDTRVYPPAVLQVFAEETVNDPSLSASLMAHLMTHPEDADALVNQQTPIAAAREFGRIIAQMSAHSGPDPVAPQTNAKPLIKPVRPSIMAPESATPDDLPFGPKYIAAMNERERKAREARRA